MEYERIHKVQTGIISPSKLRAKLMGSHNNTHHLKNADSLSNSSRASPSKHEEDSEFVKSGLLSSMNDDKDQNAAMPPSSSSAPPHQPADETLDDESKGRSMIFKFHEGGGSLCLSKWNDDEKCFTSRQGQAYFPTKRAVALSNGSRLPVRVAPECRSCHDHRLHSTDPIKHSDEVDFINITTSTDNFAFDSPSLFEIYDFHLRGKECTTSVTHGKSSTQCSDAGRSVGTRDTGTEMTPIPSQEPSVITTPVGVETPIHSPSSPPPTPGRVFPALESTRYPNKKLQKSEEVRGEMCEEETEDKTRKEIAELGTQLGKTKIAEWARRGGTEYNNNCADSRVSSIIREENVKRAWAWEEAQKAKHFARYKREEIKIEAWESQNKAKLEAEMIGVKVRVEEMRARAQAEMVKKIAMARQRSEERKASAMMRRKRGVEKIARGEKKLILKRGQLTATSFLCWKWF